MNFTALSTGTAVVVYAVAAAAVSAALSSRNCTKTSSCCHRVLSFCLNFSFLLYLFMLFYDTLFGTDTRYDDVVDNIKHTFSWIVSGATDLAGSMDGAIAATSSYYRDAQAAAAAEASAAAAADALSEVLREATAGVDVWENTNTNTTNVASATGDSIFAWIFGIFLSNFLHVFAWLSPWLYAIGCGSLMTFSLGFIFLIVTSKYILSMNEPSNQTERREEGNLVLILLAVYVSCSSYVAYLYFDSIFSVMLWLAGVVFSLVCFGISADSKRLAHHDNYWKIFIRSTRLLHILLQNVHIRLQTFATILLLENKEKEEEEEEEEEDAAAAAATTTTRGQQRYWSQKMLFLLRQMSGLALGAMDHSNNIVRSYEAVPDQRTRSRNKDQHLAVSMNNLFNWILFVVGLFFQAKWLVLISLAGPLLGLVVGALFVDWSNTNKKQPEQLNSQTFIRQLYHEDQFIHVRRLTRKTLTFFSLTSFSLTLASLLLLPLMIGMCVGAVVAVCETIVGAALAYCVAATNAHDTKVAATETNANVPSPLTATTNDDVQNEKLHSSKEEEEEEEEQKETEKDGMFPTCVVCWSDDVDGVKCSEEHFTCNNCINLHSIQMFPNPSKIDPRRMKELIGVADGRLRCPQHMLSLGKKSCSAEPFGGHALLRLTPENVERVMEARAWGKEQLMFERKTKEYAISIKKIKKHCKIQVKLKQDRTLLTEQLLREMPNAKQCGNESCKYGPIDHGWCDNLSTHHGEVKSTGAKISNACPKCGWFESSAKKWPSWNGKLPQECDPSIGKGDKKRRKKKKSTKPRPQRTLTTDLQRLVSEHMMTEEQARAMMPPRETVVVEEEEEEEEEEDDGTEDVHNDDIHSKEAIYYQREMNQHVSYVVAATLSILCVCCYAPSNILSLGESVVSWCVWPFTVIFGEFLVNVGIGFFFIWHAVKLIKGV